MLEISEAVLNLEEAIQTKFNIIHEQICIFTMNSTIEVYPENEGKDTKRRNKIPVNYFEVDY